MLSLAGLSRHGTRAIKASLIACDSYQDFEFWSNCHLSGVAGNLSLFCQAHPPLQVKSVAAGPRTCRTFGQVGRPGRTTRCYSRAITQPICGDDQNPHQSVSRATERHPSTTTLRTPVHFQRVTDRAILPPTTERSIPIKTKPLCLRFGVGFPHLTSWLLSQSPASSVKDQTASISCFLCRAD